VALHWPRPAPTLASRSWWGTRRRDDGGNLLDRFGGALERSTSMTGYFAEEDLAAYALACLQLAGDERPGNPNPR